MTLIATPATSTRNGAAPASLAGRLAAGDACAVVTFAGQGVDVLEELAALAAQRPELRAGISLATEVLGEVAASDLARASGAYRHGVDVAAWVLDPDGAPPLSLPARRRRRLPAQPAGPGHAVAAVWADAIGDAIRPARSSELAGHSQGLLAALLVAESPGGEIDDTRLAAHLRRAAVQGIHMSAASTGRSPMVAIDGIPLARLEPFLAAPVSIALVNTPTRVVVAGPPAMLDLLHTRLTEQARREAAERRDGRRGGAPLTFEWSPLAVDVPFHSPALAEALARFGDDEASEGWAPVLGLNGHSPARAQFVEPVRWDAVARDIRDLGADWVLDLGPGTAVARLTAENLRGSGLRTLALASPEGRRVLTSPGAAPAGRDVDYATFAPRVDARGHLETRYSRATGRPPVILAGMTPTTVDAPIVAAAANAGYMAELAGGGQPDRRTFELRVEELAALLEPGREVVFNTLLLDRHLWGLHVEREALLFGARRAGAPFAGLTVSAGVPDVDEAIALLDRLAAEGMRLNAFKPGTASRSAGCSRSRTPRRTTRSPRTSKAAAPAGTTRGRTSRNCCWRPTTSCAGATTCWCARAAGSARRSAPRTSCTGPGRWRTASRRCRSTPCSSAPPRWPSPRRPPRRRSSGRSPTRPAPPVGCRGAGWRAASRRPGATSTPTSICSTTARRAPDTCWSRLPGTPTPLLPGVTRSSLRSH